jgi:hypothetical protein
MEGSFAAIFYKFLLLSRAGTPATTSRFWGFGFRAVAGIKPPVTFQAESGGRDHFFYGSAALCTLAGRWI